MAYSDSPQKNWKKQLKKEMFEYSRNIRDNFCLITTNASFATNYIQELLEKCNKDLLIVVDEAHNFGSSNLSKLLNKDKYKYRLALSATFERHNDIEGTKKLINFFEKKCIEYTMRQAIEENMLCKYYYYPIPVHFDEDELKEYNSISYDISKAIKHKENGDIELSELAKRLLIKRSRIVAGARNKINCLKEVISKHSCENYILIYCGATIHKEDSDDSNNKDAIKQIQAVQNMLIDEVGMTCLQFTAEETSNERKLIIDEFKNGDGCQALIAIKCLDEGVNIPNIKTAFILASSTNPKEYIQRRGRVLRKSKNKDFAVIYDFITLPRNIAKIHNNEEMDYDLSLIVRELNRLREFAELSVNPIDSEKFIEELSTVYGSVVYNEGDENVWSI